MQKEKRTKAIVTCVAIAIPLLFLFSMFLLIPTLARLREDGTFGGPVFRKDTVEKKIYGTLAKGKDYKAIKDSECYVAEDCYYEELDGVYFYIFKSPRKAKRAFNRIKNSRNYYETSVVVTDYSFMGDVKDVCDASITDYYFISGNLLIGMEAVFGDGPVSIEDMDIQAEYNRETGDRTAKRIRRIKDLFFD